MNIRTIPARARHFCRRVLETSSCVLCRWYTYFGLRFVYYPVTFCVKMYYVYSAVTGYSVLNLSVCRILSRFRVLAKRNPCVTPFLSVGKSYRFSCRQLVAFLRFVVRYRLSCLRITAHKMYPCWIQRIWSTKPS